jgi:hypothetical protein
MEWFGLQGEQQPEQPVYFEEPIGPKVVRTGGRPRMTSSFPLAYLAWLRQPIEWFDEWRRRMRIAAPLPVAPAFDFEKDFFDLVELMG